MSPTQQNAAAAGFIQALYDSATLRAQWVEIQSNGWEGLGALIQSTLGLAVTPSDADLAAMRIYSKSYTPASPADLAGEDPSVNPVCIFNGAATAQD